MEPRRSLLPPASTTATTTTATATAGAIVLREAMNMYRDVVSIASSPSPPPILSSRDIQQFAVSKIEQAWIRHHSREVFQRLKATLLASVRESS